MNQRETLNLVSLVAHLCPAMRIEDRTAEAWHMVIGHLDAEDCVLAVRAIAARKPFIAPSDIVEEVGKIRTHRLESANHVFEPREGESVADANTRLALERSQAASGQTVPTLALPPGGPAPAPASIGRLVAEVRAARDHPALKAPCPWPACKAPAGKWCEKPRGGGGAQAKSGFLHPSRCETAGVQFVPVVPELTAEQRAERELSRAMAAQRAAEGER